MLSRGANGAGMKRAWLLGAGVLVCLGAGAARAQTFGEALSSDIPLDTKTGRNLGVADRQRAELEQLGIALQGFRLYPVIDEGVGDGYVLNHPAITALSTWSRHALSASLSYTGKRYFSTGAKDEDGYNAQVGGSLNLARDGLAVGELSQTRRYEDQIAASYPLGGGSAVAIDQSHAMVRLAEQFDQTRLTGSYSYDHLRYHDSQSTTGITLDQTYRNADISRISGRLEYRMTPDNAFFGQISYHNTAYAATSGPLDRSSREWQILGGAIGDVGGLVRLAFTAGLYSRSYANPLYTSHKGLALDLRAEWFLTPLVTVSGIAKREVRESNFIGSSGYTATAIGVHVDHELLRNLLLNLSATGESDQFFDTDRTDRVYDASFGVDYAPMGRIRLLPKIEVLRRRSAGANAGFSLDELRALLTLSYRP